MEPSAPGVAVEAYSDNFGQLYEGSMIVVRPERLYIGRDEYHSIILYFEIIL